MQTGNFVMRHCCDCAVKRQQRLANHRRRQARRAAE